MLIRSPDSFALQRKEIFYPSSFLIDCLVYPTNCTTTTKRKWCSCNSCYFRDLVNLGFCDWNPEICSTKSDRIRFSNTPGLLYGASADNIRDWYETKQNAAQHFFKQLGKENRLFILPVEKAQNLAPDLLGFLFNGNTSKVNVTLEYPQVNVNR